MQKVNPRRKPATQEDVNRAWGEGCIEGIRCMEAIVLNCLCDKYADDIDVGQFWGDLNKLKEEYKILLLTGPSKAIYNARRTK